MSRRAVIRVELWIQSLILLVSLVMVLAFAVPAWGFDQGKDNEQDTHMAYIDGQIRQLQADQREVQHQTEDNRFTIAKDEGYALGGFAAISLFQGIGIVVAAFLKKA